MVWRLAVEMATLLRENKKSSAGTVGKYTIYSNEIGKEVSMEHLGTISGSEIWIIWGN